MLPFEPSKFSASLLLVEDDAAGREVASTSLRLKFPFLELYEAADGEQGLEAYKRHLPDVVLTDIQMPAMNGLCMVRRIRKINPQAHVIVISAHTEVPYLLEAIKMGIAHYVLKPLEHRPLFEAVAACLAQVELERQVRSQEQYIAILSQVVEENARHIAIADPAGRIRYVNRTFLDVSGYDTGELLGRELRHLHFHRSAHDFGEIWKTVNGGTVWRGEGISKRKDGTLYHEAVSIAPITDGTGYIRHFVTIREDVTERQQSLEALDRARKLEALAGGIAHDFNNILTGILGNISFAQSLIAKSDTLRDPLDEAAQASDRAVELTRQLLTCARGHSPLERGLAVRPAGEPRPDVRAGTTGTDFVPPAGGAVLLMDDEAMVRKVSAKMIESLGYRVTTCANGDEAIALYARAREIGDTYVAAIFDLTVPGGTGGKDAAAAIRALDPGAKLVISSGFYDDPILTEYRQHGFSFALPKPYKLADVAELLEQVRKSRFDLRACGTDQPRSPAHSSFATGTAGSAATGNRSLPTAWPLTSKVESS